ncbi:MAG: hypothetical protein XD40_2262, partial [Archaeoglobus fulgidus]
MIEAENMEELDISVKEVLKIIGRKGVSVVSRNNFTPQQDCHVRKLTNKDILRIVK